VGVDSALGEGSRFWLTARLGRAREAVAPEAGLPPEEQARTLLRRDHRGARILLVEDEPINQEVGLLLLRDAGLAPDLAEDGVEAVRMAGEHDYALILMDMQLPKLDGLAATSAIRGLLSGAATPILAMSASAFEEDRRAFLAAGMDDFVAKPVVPTQFYAMLLKWLDHR
jgi:CheY-like chemotaxis protein